MEMARKMNCCRVFCVPIGPNTGSETQWLRNFKMLKRSDNAAHTFWTCTVLTTVYNMENWPCAGVHGSKA